MDLKTPNEQTAHELAMMALAISVQNSEKSSDCAVVLDYLMQEYHRNFGNLYQAAVNSLNSR